MSGVPIVPFVPVAEPEPASGTNDANGTPLIYMAGEPSEAARAVAHEAVIGEADAPAAWREALLGLFPDRDPCPGFRPHAWARVWANALDFIDRHGVEAHGLGWTAEELFGVHPVVGVIRVDCCGALMLSSAGRVLAVEADLIRHTNGLAFRRSFSSAASVPVWQRDQPRDRNRGMDG